MAKVFSLTPFSLFPSPSSVHALASVPIKRSRNQFKLSTSASSAMNHQHEDLRKNFMEFPHVSPARRELMVDLISKMENRLGSQLLPCGLPPDVQYFGNQNGTAQASLHIRSGHDSSPVDFILGSWIHCDLPTGASLNITSITAYLNSSTDAPNFVIELIQNSPNSLVIILDLPHRKDLILHPDYLQTFYEETNLDSHRQSLLNLHEATSYVSPSLFVRCAFSPAAVMVKVNAEEERLEEIVTDHVGLAAKEVVGLWLDRCVSGNKREIGEHERIELEKRDRRFRSKTIDVDLGSSFPRMFGDEVSDRVLSVLREAFVEFARYCDDILVDVPLMPEEQPIKSTFMGFQKTWISLLEPNAVREPEETLDIPMSNLILELDHGNRFHPPFFF